MGDEPLIDEGLYSRQLYVLGENSMKRLGKCDVLISGLGGLGVEIAKNLVLAGVRGVTLHDEEVVKYHDLSSQFFASSDDLERNRAEVCQDKLSDLNKYVEVSYFKGILNDHQIIKHKAVILTESTIENNVRIGNLCYKNDIYFLSANVAGVFGQIFCDFGDNFEIEDKYHQPPSIASIDNISKVKNELIIHLEKNSKSSFGENDYVTFEGVNNMEHLNNSTPVPIKNVFNNHKFSIENIDDFLNRHGDGGVVREVRFPETIHFRSYGESLETLENIHGADRILHVAFQILDKFRVKNGGFPRPHSKVDAAEFVEMFSNFIENHKIDLKFNENLLYKFSMTSSGSLCPMHSIIGSIAAQEIIKAITKKFIPIQQWFYFNACNVLPPNFDDLTEDECDPRGSRYDSQVAIFGTTHQENIMNSKLFMVGVGAIGCEMLKNWAMMGIGSGCHGRVTITDMDMIEKSNLNRQFLFRPEHVGKMKSTTASEMVRKLMNSDMRIDFHENKVSEETEDVYDEDFYGHIDVVVNALDNIPTRKYVADKCVLYYKPLLESGTEGTMCSVQVILPGLSCSYSSQESDESIPLCTLKYFPTSVVHTIQWARDEFEGSFKLNVKTAYDFLKDKNFLENSRNLSGIQPVEKLREVLDVVEDLMDNGDTEMKDLSNYERCIKWARLKFEKLFNNQILQLRHNFPPNSTTKEGLPFWCGSKKCPTPINFDPNNPLHVDFIIAAANMMALGFESCDTRKDVAIIASSIDVPIFAPKSEVFIPTDDEQAKQQEQDSFDSKEYDELVTRIPDAILLDKLNLQLQCIDFEKDNSFHVDFITATSNLRAINYGISPVDKLETKRIVGKIIPAIATTTSLVVGLVCLELLKLLCGHKELTKFKNWYCVMSSCMFQSTNVRAATKYKYNDKEFSLWDHFHFEDVTIEELINEMRVENKLNVDGIFYGKSSILSSMTSIEESKIRLKMKVSQAIERVAGPLPSHVKSIILDIAATDEHELDVEHLPPVIIKLMR